MSYKESNVDLEVLQLLLCSVHPAISMENLAHISDPQIRQK